MITRIEDFRKLLERLDTLSIILEKRIEVGNNLTKKLTNINSNLSKWLLQFLNSDDIKDDVDVDYVDYNKEDGKLFTIGYKDRNGNDKKRLLKINKLVSYLNSSLSTMKDYEVEELISHLTDVDTSGMKLISGDDILYYYLGSNYDSEMTSCMQSEEAQNYLEIYTSNPGVVQLLVLVNPDNNKLWGRALVWTCTSGARYMDRVYVVNNKYNAYFNTYAEENKFLITVGDEEVQLDVDGEYDYYPFMDTFKYYTPDTGILTTDDGELELQEQNGKCTRSTIVHTSVYGGRDIDINDSLLSNYYGDYILWDDAVEVSKGDHEGEYILDIDSIEDYNGDIVPSRDTVEITYGKHKGEYALQEETCDDYNVETVLLEECIELTAGQHEGEHCLRSKAYVLLSGDNKDAIISEDDINDFDGIEMKEYNS